MRLSARINAFTPYTKFASNCAILGDKLAPLLVPAAATAAAAAAAPAIGILSVVTALGAVGIVLTDLFRDVSQNRDTADIKKMLEDKSQLEDQNQKLLEDQTQKLEDLESRIATSGRMVALTLSAVDDLKAFLKKRDKSSQSDVPQEYRFLNQILTDRPDFAPGLIAKLEAMGDADVADKAEARLLQQRTADALEILARNECTPPDVREAILPDLKTIRKDLSDMSGMLKGILTIVALAFIGVVVTVGLVHSIIQGQKETDKKIHDLLVYQRRVEEDHYRENRELRNQAEEDRRAKDAALEENKGLKEENARYLAASQGNSAPEDPSIRSFPSVEAHKAFEDYQRSDGLGDEKARFTSTTRLIELAPLDPRSWFYHGFSAFELAGPHDGDPDLDLMRTARDADTKAIQLIKDFQIDRNLLSNAFTNLGAAQFYLGDAKAAEESHRKAISVDPANALAYMNLDSVYLRFFPERIGDRIEDLRLGIEAVGQNQDLRDRLVGALADQFGEESRAGRAGAALVAIDEIISLEGEHPRNLIGKWFILRTLNDFEGMRKTVSRAIELSETVEERAECLLLSFWTERIEHPAESVVEKPEFLAIKSTLEGIDVSRLEDPSLLDYLHVLYYAVAGDLASAQEVISGIPEGSEHLDLASTVILPLRLEAKKLQIAEMSNRVLSGEESELDASKILKGLFADMVEDVKKQDQKLAEVLEKILVVDLESPIGIDAGKVLVAAGELKLANPDGVLHGMACYFAAFAYSQLGESAKAVAEYREAYEHAPTLWDTSLADYSRQLLLSGNADECVAELEKGNERLGASVERSLILVDALVSLGRQDDSVKEARRVFGVLRDDPGASGLLVVALIKKATALYNESLHLDGEEALDLLEEANLVSEEACGYQTHLSPLAFGLRSTTLAALVSMVPSEWVEPAKQFLLSQELTQSGMETSREVSGLRGMVLLKGLTSPQGSDEYMQTLEQARGLLRFAVESPFTPVFWWENLLWITTELDPISESVRLVTDFSRLGKYWKWSSEVVADSQGWYAGVVIEMAVNRGLMLSGDEIDSLIGILDLARDEVDDPHREADHCSSLGFAHFLKGDFTGSGDFHREASRLDPQRWRDWTNYSDRLLRQSRFLEAFGATLRSMEAFPWGKLSYYRELFPILGNLFLASSVVVLPLLCGALALGFWRRRRRSKFVAST